MSIVKRLLFSVVKARAGCKCERCGDVEPRMHIHHRNGYKDDNRLANLDYLCAHCHRRVHFYTNRTLIAKYRDSERGRKLHRMLLNDKLWKTSYKRWGDKETGSPICGSALF